MFESISLNKLTYGVATLHIENNNKENLTSILQKNQAQQQSDADKFFEFFKYTAY